jgi:YbgC/YbaW family acyl-CoA thioester hydrolase
MFSHSIIIKEQHLDTLGHVNNAVYLTLFEEARWQFLDSKNYPLEVVMKEKKGPVILDLQLKFFKELKLRDQVQITFEAVDVQKKVAILKQQMINARGEVAAELTMTSAFFDLQTRRIIEPNEAWKYVLGKS